MADRNKGVPLAVSLTAANCMRIRAIISLAAAKRYASFGACSSHMFNVVTGEFAVMSTGASSGPSST